MRKFKISVNDHWYEIEITDLDESPISVLVDGELYEVELGPEITRTEAAEVRREEPKVLAPEPAPAVSKPTLRQALRQAQEGPQDTAVVEGEVIAPMPGKILAINVGVDDRVQYKDVLCTLEAMKMENEIMAPGGGVVTEIKVAEGQDVLYGDVLLVIG
jgi:biotin carboxyl carrier protein